MKGKARMNSGYSGPEKGFPRLDRRQTGRRIKIYMQMRGFSVEDVRERLMLESVQSVYHWLEGKSLPSVDNLYALGILLRVPVDCLLCGEQRRSMGSVPGGGEEARVRRWDFYLNMVGTVVIQDEKKGLH